MSIAMQDHYANQKADVNELIKSHSNLVRKIAWQVHGRTRHTTEIEDVMQVGFTGLVNAAQQYTRKEGATFATYASIRIKGAIIDYLRKSSNLCRTTIQIKKKYNKVVQGLQTKLMRHPNPQEISVAMGMSEHELQEWEQAFQANAHDSLGDVYDQYSIWYASDDDTPEEKLNNQELKELLKSALHTLAEREMLVIQLYYIEELNVFEIAEVMNVSTGRISQIKKSAIANLRDFISDSQHID
jgi:RNA polymerase sigma factor for flagellar operon FliA